MKETDQNLSLTQIWLLAARPKTLPAAAAPVLLGTAFAVKHGHFSMGAAFAALLGAMLIQIGTNLANDYFDFKQGADTAERLGPIRVTQAGLLPPESVASGMWAMFGLAALVGLYLIYVAGWPVVLIGIFSILAGIAYTGGPFPLAYNGLGDLFVFIFFGLIAVNGTYFVQALTINETVIWASVPIGLLATAILVVNNLRDIETDLSAGKHTLAVRFGVKGTRQHYLITMIIAYLVPIILVLLDLVPNGVLVVFLTLFRLIPLLKIVFQESGRVLNLALSGTGRLELEYSILFSIGLFLMI